jgi:hypothetical protein
MEGILDTIGKFLQNIKSPVPSNQDIRTPQGADLANYASDTNQAFGNTPSLPPTPPQPQSQPQQPIIAKQPMFSNGTPAVSVMPTIPQDINTVANPEIKNPAPAANSPDDLTKQIQAGFMDWGNGKAPNAATLSAQFAQAGKDLPDPYLPAILALKETRGGTGYMADKNNLMNIQYGGINNSPYETPQDNIVGGDGHKGFVGLIHNGMYDKYLKSGDLHDFFKVYTPTYDNNGKQINAPIDEQIKEYNDLRSHFMKGLKG